LIQSGANKNDMQKLIDTPYSQKEIEARTSDNICWDCGLPFLSEDQKKQFNVVTANTGICGLCQQEKTVTNFRNWNWLKINERIRGNMYGKLVKRKKDAYCGHCNGLVAKGDHAFTVEKKDGYKNIYIGVFHINCFDLFDCNKKPVINERNDD
jgi:hypothetical protein